MAAWLAQNGPISIGINANMMQVLYGIHEQTASHPTQHYFYMVLILLILQHHPSSTHY